MEALTSLATAAGLGWASGIRLYAVVFFLGLLQYFGIYHLPANLQVVGSPWVMGASGFMFLVEFLADKIPGFDSVWDATHTFIRIPAGALLAAAAVAGGDPGLSLAAGILGGAVAAGSHVTKASTRALINTSPEPFSNIAASLATDALVVTGLYLALTNPITFLCLLALFIALLVWLLPKLVRLALLPFRRLMAEKPMASKKRA